MSHSIQTINNKQNIINIFIPYGMILKMTMTNLTSMSYIKVSELFIFLAKDMLGKGYLEGVVPWCGW